jgi:hypothetical protein
VSDIPNPCPACGLRTDRWGREAWREHLRNNGGHLKLRINEEMVVEEDDCAGANSAKT